MARPRSEIPSTKIRFEGSRKRHAELFPRDFKTFEWLEKIPNGQRFAFAWELMTAALNGELGPAMQAAAEESDIDKAREAAAHISDAFVIDDD
jgi:hypothetical protein